MQAAITCLVLSLGSARSGWMEKGGRYGPEYTGGYQIFDAPRPLPCMPCDDRWPNNPSNSLEDNFRGNGADNLGYDWTPKAWGGPAFPKSKENERMQESWRGGRMMPMQRWGDMCGNCAGDEGWRRPSRNWDRHTEKPGNWDDRNRGHPSSTERPRDWSSKPTESPSEATVTSPILGIRYPTDKRLPVEWEKDGGRSMRWDGFRNGMPWGSLDTMDRRNWEEPSGFRPWDGTGKGVAGWDDNGRGHYAAGWNYDSPPKRDWATSESKWNTDRPWSQSADERDRRPGYGGGSNPQFGSSYPHQNNYPTERPKYPSNSWSSSPSTNYYNYPTTNRPGYPEIVTVRPSYQDTASRPSYGTTPSHYQPNQPFKPQGGSTSWNYDGGRPTPRPDQNYLPQNRPGYDYERPTRPGGTPGVALWNGRPNEYESRPIGGSSYPKPSKGVYQGFITEIHDPNHAGGNKYPTDRPGYGDRDRFPSNNQYPSQDRFPGGSQYPSQDRFPGGSQYPSQDRFPGGNQYPSQDRFPGGSQYPSQDRFPGGNQDPSNNQRPGNDRPYDRNPNYQGNQRPSYDNDNRRPSYGGDRYPSNDKDRYDGNRDRDRYPNNDRDRYPSPDRPQSSNRYPSNQYPSSDRYPSNDRHPSSDRYPSSDNDRYPRPGSSDHDRGPNPSSDSGSWNYGEGDHKDGTYRRSGGSYPLYKGGHYFTSSYLASASTPAAASHDPEKKDETTVAPLEK